MSVRTLKMQATLKGFSAFALEKLAEKKGQTLADVANYLFELWVDKNKDFLKGFGITQEQFELAEEERGGRVLHMPNATGGHADE
jgi:uncharacterized protein YgfB (UPF0149 family)